MYCRYSMQLLILTLSVLFKNSVTYNPTWESLESRPIPNWFDQSKLGIFVHWGIYSVPGYKDYATHYAAWFWNDWHYGSVEHLEYMTANYPPSFTYPEFAHEFKAEFFDPVHWAELFKKSGAKYVVLTSKHHEGFTLYPSKYSFGWNSQDIGPKRDIVGDLATAIRNTTNLKFGLYHSLFEWFNPLFQSDKQNGFTTDQFVQTKSLPTLYELVDLYKPEIIWSDGEFDASSDYWQSKEFIAWLYNESPVKDTVVTNDRWGNETICKRGGYLTCADHYNPGVLQPRKWENCMTLDRHAFSIRKNSKFEDYLSPEELIKTLIETVSCGGNMLLNVGPTAEGTIEPIQQERLHQLGEWLGINGNAIYESVPWTSQNDSVTSGLWYTSNPSRKQIYGIFFNWPSDSEIKLGDLESSIVESINLFGSTDSINWREDITNNGVVVSLPAQSHVSSKWAWTLVINEVQS